MIGASRIGENEVKRETRSGGVSSEWNRRRERDAESVSSLGEREREGIGERQSGGVSVKRLIGGKEIRVYVYIDRYRSI